MLLNEKAQKTCRGFNVIVLAQYMINIIVSTKYTIKIIVLTVHIYYYCTYTVHNTSGEQLCWRNNTKNVFRIFIIQNMFEIKKSKSES